MSVALAIEILIACRPLIAKLTACGIDTPLTAAEETLLSEFGKVDEFVNEAFFSPEWAWDDFRSAVGFGLTDIGLLQSKWYKLLTSRDPKGTLVELESFLWGDMPSAN
jgi:hypothetical protein